MEKHNSGNTRKKVGVIKTKLVDSISKSVVGRLNGTQTDKKGKGRNIPQPGVALDVLASTALANFLLGSKNENDSSPIEKNDSGMIIRPNSSHKKIEDNGPNSEGVVHRLALKLVKSQRDMYVVGNSKVGDPKQHQEHRNDPVQPPAFYHLINLSSWLIPSTQAIESLRPTVLHLPTGVLQEPTGLILSNNLPLAQPFLDKVVKNNLAWFLNEERYRIYVKEKTQGFIVEKVSIGSSAPQQKIPEMAP